MHRLAPALLPRASSTAPAANAASPERREMEEEILRLGNGALRRVVMRVQSSVASVASVAAVTVVVAAADVGEAGEVAVVIVVIAVAVLATVDIAVLAGELLEDAGLALEDLAAQLTATSEEVLGGGRVDGGPHLADCARFWASSEKKIGCVRSGSPRISTLAA